jgi:low affinity Fe/Cu permease
MTMVPQSSQSEKLSLFGRVANATAHASGRPVTFALCCLIVIVWAVSGPFFHYSDTWQLVINTGTTIVTFLMVFLIQNTQNRDGAALQAKLDELIRVTEAARNDYVGVEKMPEKKLEELRENCEADAAGPR